MDKLHKQILRTNRTALIDNIAKPDDVSDLLFERGIFTESMRQDVEAQNTNIEKTRHILDLIPRRGPKAFDAFVDALTATVNDTARDILLAGGAGGAGVAGTQSAGSGQHGTVGYAIPTQSAELPPDWPNERAMTQEIKVRPASVHSSLVRNKWLSDDVYSIRKSVRGRCVIISNKLFYGPREKDQRGIERCILTDRYGTEHDESGLNSLFGQLQFDVITHKDKRANEMLEILESESKHPGHHQAECFVCIICSHGTRQGIYGVDGGVIHLDQVTSLFDGDRCAALRGKPKVFFIQACQGEETDIGIHTDNVDAGPDLSDLVEKMSLENQVDVVKEAHRNVAQARNMPAKVDFLVASATHPGYVSLRNTHYGSWFIQAVIYVFQRFAGEKHILELLTLVNKLVAKGRTPHEGSGEDRVHIMQAAVSITSLLRDLYFFPGIIEHL